MQINDEINSKYEILSRIFDLCNVELIIEDEKEKKSKNQKKQTDYIDSSSTINKKNVYLRDRNNEKQKLWLSSLDGSLEIMKDDEYEFDYDEEIDKHIIYSIFLEYIKEYKLLNICEENKNGIISTRFTIPSFNNLIDLQIKLDLMKPIHAK